MVGFQNTRVLSASGRIEIMGMKALRDVYIREENFKNYVKCVEVVYKAAKREQPSKVKTKNKTTTLRHLTLQSPHQQLALDASVLREL